GGERLGTHHDRARARLKLKNSRGCFLRRHAPTATRLPVTPHACGLYCPTMSNKQTVCIFMLSACLAATAQADEVAFKQLSLAEATEGLPAKGKLMADITTSEGKITCELFPESAPKTVASFVGLAPRAAALEGSQDRQVGDVTVLRRARVPPGDPRVHDPGRGSAVTRVRGRERGHGRAGLHAAGRDRPHAAVQQAG